MSVDSNFKDEVFSTYVEVILDWRTAYVQPSGVLHVCGGDPEAGKR